MTKDERAVRLAGMWRMAGALFGRRSGIEEPRYDLLGRAGAAEIRQYHARIAAETVVAAPETGARYEGFRRLAGYIFGANQARTKIAMTAPVAQGAETIAMTAPVAQSRAQGETWTIRFFMPASYTLDTLPHPADPRVALVQVPPEIYAVVRFAGRPAPARVARETQALLAGLENRPWQAQGEPAIWFYDPPWTIPSLRRNEVAVRVSSRGARG